MERDWRDVELSLPASPVQRTVPPPVVLPERLPDVVVRANRGERVTESTDTPAVERTRLVLIGAPLAANEPIRVIRMRVTSSALGELGLGDVTSAEVVDIDVLVGEDGVARGVRMSM
jgi:hypothetical protein